MDDTKLLLSRVKDLIRNNCGEDNFLGFFNEHETSVVSTFLDKNYVEYSLYGGYENATRVMLSLGFSDSQFPITPLHVKSRGTKSLTHRDYLGSLMGLGIKRECVGDIITLNDKEAVVFVRSDISAYIQSELSKVASSSVNVSLYQGDTSEFTANFEQLRLIVSSMRIDNVVSACANCSRAGSAQLISGEKVFVNYLQANKPSKLLSEGDVISIRGCGKFIIAQQMGITKKDRLVINVLHYK